MTPGLWIITAGCLLGILAIGGALLYRLGLRHGARRCRKEARTAYDLGLRDGRREERHETAEAVYPTIIETMPDGTRRTLVG